MQPAQHPSVTSHATQFGAVHRPPAIEDDEWHPRKLFQSKQQLSPLKRHSSSVKAVIHGAASIPVARDRKRIVMRSFIIVSSGIKLYFIIMNL